MFRQMTKSRGGSAAPSVTREDDSEKIKADWEVAKGGGANK